MQEILTLLLVYVLTCLGADVLLQLEQLQLLVQSLQCEQHTFLYRACGQHCHLVRNGERQVGADEIYGYDVIVYVVECELRLVGYFFVLFDIADGCGAQIVERGLELIVACLGHLLSGSHGHTFQERFCGSELTELAPSESLNYYGHVLIVARHLEQPHQFGIDTVFVEVVLLRVVNIDILLTENGESSVLGFLQIVYKIDAYLPADKNR